MPVLWTRPFARHRPVLLNVFPIKAAYDFFVVISTRDALMDVFHGFGVPTTAVMMAVLFGRKMAAGIITTPIRGA